MDNLDVRPLSIGNEILLNCNLASVLSYLFKIVCGRS